MDFLTPEEYAKATASFRGRSFKNITFIDPIPEWIKKIVPNTIKKYVYIYLQVKDNSDFDAIYAIAFINNDEVIYVRVNPNFSDLFGYSDYDSKMTRDEYFINTQQNLIEYNKLNNWAQIPNDINKQILEKLKSIGGTKKKTVLDKCTISELRERASKRGISLTGLTKKADIITKIRGKK